MKTNARSLLVRSTLSAFALGALSLAGCKGDSKESSEAPAAAKPPAEEPPKVDPTPKAEVPTEPKAEVAEPVKELKDDAETIEVAKTSVGPIALGTSKASVETLGLATHPQFSGMTVPYSVYYKDDKVAGVQVSLKDAKRPIVVAGKTLPKEGTLAEVAEAIGTCGEVELRVGGNIHRCADGVIVSIGSVQTAGVWVGIHADEVK